MDVVASQMELKLNQAHAFYDRHRQPLLLATLLMALLLASAAAVAGTAADTWAAASYTFISNMATGNVMRGICIVGGLLGTLAAAANGRPVLALTGVGLAIFGFLSPTMINAVFGTALI